MVCQAYKNYKCLLLIIYSFHVASHLYFSSPLVIIWIQLPFSLMGLQLLKKYSALKGKGCSYIIYLNLL